MSDIQQDNVPGAPAWAGGSFAWQFYEPSVGDVVRQEYPFTRMQGPCWSDLGKGKAVRWRPGVWDSAFIPPDGFGAVAHGMGWVCIRIVHVASLPKPYPRRVFYTRQFTDPDGNEYKKSALSVHAITKFRQVAGPFRLGGYAVKPNREPLRDENAETLVDFA